MQVMCDELGRSKGFGFVCFSSLASANRAIPEMNGLVVAGKALFVAVAQPKEERRMMIQQSMVPQVPQASPMPLGWPSPPPPVGVPWALAHWSQQGLQPLGLPQQYSASSGRLLTDSQGLQASGGHRSQRSHHHSTSLKKGDKIDPKFRL